MADWRRPDQERREQLKPDFRTRPERRLTKSPTSTGAD
jgi:hypothetical protein